MACRSRSSNAAPVNSIRSKTWLSRQGGNEDSPRSRDADTLDTDGRNATELARRYRDLGGAAEIVLLPLLATKRGHDGPELYESAALVEFLLGD